MGNKKKTWVKGFDWLILNSLDGKEIDKIEISTHHFKGNYPSHCSLQATYIPKSKNSKAIVNSSVKWKYLLKGAKLSSNKVHIFKNNLMKKNKINFIKINIFPDGGISRFRILWKKCMTNLTIKPKVNNKENFKKFGDMITTDDIKPLEINDGYAKRFDGIANLDAKKDDGNNYN